MKINLPVTDDEYILKESDSIVSKSDLKGLITYASEGFIRISGYSKEELIGSAHNIVRHPDMPSEVFEDLWRTMHAGHPWTGMIKNRSKSGGYYWALTNITPFYENDQLVGYMAVRSKPSHEQIDAASSAYQLFRDNKIGSLKVQDGKVVKPTLLPNFNFFKNLSIKFRLVFVIGFLSILMMVIGGLGLQGMSKTNEGLHMVYKSRTIAMNQIFKISELQRDNLMLIATSLVTPTPDIVKQNNVEMEQNITEINRLWNAYLLTSQTPEEKKLADNFTKANLQFVQKGLKAAATALETNDLKLVNKIRTEYIRPYYRLIDENIRKLMQLQVDVAKKEYELAQIRYDNTRNLIIGITLAGITLALWLGFTLIRAIVRPLDAAIIHFGHIAQGNYKTIIEIESMNEVGKVMAALKAMQIKQGFDVAETKRIADEHMPVKIALDNVSTGLMIADNDRKIIYVNKAVEKILGKAEMDIRKQLPNFAVTDLIGTHIDCFHKNPAYQAESIANMHATQMVHLEIGGRTLVLTLNPVFNQQNQRLGTVAEWQDRTNEVVVEKEIDAILHGAVMGDFSRRIDVYEKEGFFKQLGEDLNELLETTEKGINDVERALRALSHSDLTEIITNDYSGSLGKLKDDTNATVEKLKEFVIQITAAIGASAVDTDLIALGANDPSSSKSTTFQSPTTMQKLSSDLPYYDPANVERVSQLAQEAFDRTDKGIEVVNKCTLVIAEINNYSSKARTLIPVIDDIVSQANMLALMAEVEAARPGEQGRGLSVVAVEVRNLSQRAINTLFEIKELYDCSLNKVREGNELVAEAKLIMEHNHNAMGDIRVQISQLSQFLEVQMACIKKINQAIEKWIF